MREHRNVEYLTQSQNPSGQASAACGGNERRLGTFFRSISFCVCVCVLVGGCVRSLHPFYEKGHSVFDSRLVGAWDAQGGPGHGRWVVSRQGEEAAYRLEYTADGKTDVFRVHLTKIGDRNYLDLSLSETNDAIDELSDFAKWHVLPIHTVARIDLKNDAATISFLHPHWLDKLLRAEPAALHHERRGLAGPLLVTASTDELQTFVEEHADETAAWRLKTQLKRQVEIEKAATE